MNTWSFQHGSQSTKVTDPFTYTNPDIMKKNFDNIQEEAQINYKEGIKNDKIKNYSKDLKYEGQRTNEMRNMTFKGHPKENSQIKEEDIAQDQNIINEENDFNNKYIYNNNIYDENEYDEIYYISEFIPPQNFSQKLKNIKFKYQKLKEEIEFLKKENKKYNPNFIIKNYNKQNNMNDII